MPSAESDPPPTLRRVDLPGRDRRLIETVVRSGVATVATTLRHARARLMQRRARARLVGLPRPLRLCLGSGAAPIEGWTNVDLIEPADVLVDLRYPIPLERAAVSRIYSEHVVEHLSLEDGMRLFHECRRILEPGGRMRIATPDLTEVIRDYSTDWRRHDWVQWPEYAWIDSGTRMVNVSFHAWGHLYLYDYEELACRLYEAGFSHVERCELGESTSDDLRGLETRADSKLIVEAVA